MNVYKKYTTALIGILLLTACSKNVLNEDSRGVLTADLLLTTQQGFQNALNGLYNEVRRYHSGQTYTNVNDIMCMAAVIGVDDACGNWRDPTVDVFNDWGILNNSSFSLYYNIWTWLYETINSANTIIGRADNPGINWASLSDKDNIVAQARFIRAWCYRHLTYLWGDVPLTLTESNGATIKTNWERTPVAEVRDQMRADWKFAEQNLPVTSTSDAQILQGAASTYLAELYLSMGDPDSAKIEAQKVIDDPAYALITARYGVEKSQPGTPFTDMFLDGNTLRSQGNTEALWVIQNDENVVGGEGYNIMRRYWVNRYYSLSVKGTNGKSTHPIAVSADNGGRGIGRLSPTRFEMNLYTPGDDRGSIYAWRYYYLSNTNPPKGYQIGDTVFLDKTGTEKITNANWPSTRKWDWVSPTNTLIDPEYDDQMLLRLGDTYLLLAEADYDLGDLQGAADAINALRARAHAPLIQAGDVTIDFILDERARELFSEEDRRYVLLRTHKWLSRVQQDNKLAGPFVTARDTLLPIPQAVIDANQTLPMKQNPGY